ncbi:MAG: SRPBCC family protein [Candidatus Dormibacteraeota bacterium]|nr:SRPBCC family protein [Candidatus Dormibacteraeota bacterium]
MRIGTEIEIARPPEAVFSYLADVVNEASWNPWAKSVEKLTEGPIGPGSRFRGRYKRMGTVEQELVDYQPPQRLSYLSDAMGGAKMLFELEPAGSGTLVRIAGDMHPTGLMKLAQPMMGAMMRPHLRDVAAGIKRELEAVPSS